MGRATVTVFFAGAMLALAGCGAESTGPAAPADGGGALAVNVAALNLQGVGDVVWDIEVLNGASTPQVVWQRRIASSGYGDGAGSASYVGSCDAEPSARENTVRVWVVGVYAAAVADAGSFASGQATGAGAVSGSALPFQNPTTTAVPLTQTVTCRQDADVAVRFDVALMRPAEQGFFDVAVSFDDIFCSAKFDCAASPLLFDATGSRGDTVVLGLACTAGPSDTEQSVLYLDDLTLDCTTPSSESFGADLRIDPSGAPGNQCPVGALATCAAIVPPSGVAPDDYLYQVGVYRGAEQLTSGGVAAQKVFWNVALGVKRPAISGCWLRTRATAARAAGSSVITLGEVAAGAVYPYVQWDVNLASCGSEELTFGDPAAMVRTAYTGTADAGVGFAYGFGPSLPAGALCAAPCQNGGRCVERVCDCASGYSGAACEANIDECAGNPCAPGVCTDGVGTYSCACPAGTYDDVTTCADCTPITHCASGLTCTDAADSACASCDVGYVAPTCALPPSLSVTPSSATTMDVAGPSAPSYGAVTRFVVRNEGGTATDALGASLLSNTANFEFYADATAVGDGCDGVVLQPLDTCAVDVRSVASSDGAFSGQLTVGDGAVDVVADLSGVGSGWSCALPWGGSIPIGQSVTAYQPGTAACLATCPAETRSCTAGGLTGSYTAASCTNDASLVKSVNASNLITCQNNTTLVATAVTNLGPTGGHCGTGTFDWRCLGYTYAQVCFYGSICSVTFTYGGESFTTATQCKTQNNLGQYATFCTW